MASDRGSSQMWFRPYWDVVFGRTLQALIILGSILLLFCLIRSGKTLPGYGDPEEEIAADPMDVPARSLPVSPDHLTVRLKRDTNEDPDESPPPGTTTKTHRASTASFTQSRRGRMGRTSYSTDGSVSTISLTTLADNRTSGDFPMTTTTTTPTPSISRPQSDQPPIKVVSQKADRLPWMLCLLSSFVCLWIWMALFDRLFYGDHLVQSVGHILDTLNDVHQFRPQLNRGLILANTLCHSYRRNHIWRLFLLHNWLRLILTLITLAITASFYSEAFPPDNGESVMMVGLLLLVLVEVLISCYSCVWPIVMKLSAWGILMSRYCKFVEKIDVARGRCVPAPPFASSSSFNEVRALPRTTRCSLLMELWSQGPTIRQLKSGTTERVIEVLNPYASNKNVQLILDLVAYRCGIGVALRCLTFLEMDIHNNWRSFKPEISFPSGDDAGRCLELSWKEPLAVMYLSPLPKQLRLHFAIELDFIRQPDSANSYRDTVVRVFGYDEMKYFYKMQSRMNFNESKEDLAFRDDVFVRVGSDGSFTYRKCFKDVSPWMPFSVTLWTVVDGNLVAKSSLHHDPDRDWACSKNVIPKPPRSQFYEPPKEFEEMTFQAEEGDDSEPQQQEETQHNQLNTVTLRSSTFSDAKSEEDDPWEDYSAEAAVTVLLSAAGDESVIFRSKDKSANPEEANMNSVVTDPPSDDCKSVRLNEAGSHDEMVHNTSLSIIRSARKSKSLNSLSNEDNQIKGLGERSRVNSSPIIKPKVKKAIRSIESNCVPQWASPSRIRQLKDAGRDQPSTPIRRASWNPEPENPAQSPHEPDITSSSEQVFII